MWILGVLIIIGVLIHKNHSLHKEIDKYKKGTNNNQSNDIKFCPNCGYDLKNAKPGIINSTPNSTVPKKENITISPAAVNKTVTKKEVLLDKEIKNNTILITGSILIVISALVFLTSSWGIITNSLKCLVVFALFGMFVLLSNIAKNKLNLPKTARAFKYISLALFPIALVSLSVFNILGSTLAVNGPFIKMYLGIVSVISSLLYTYMANKEKDKVSYFASIIFATLGIGLAIAHFSKSFVVVLFGLFLYSYFLALLYDKEMNFFDPKLARITGKVYGIILLTLSTIILLELLLIPTLYNSNVYYNIVLTILSMISININTKKESGINLSLNSLGVIILFILLREALPISMLTISSQLIMIISIIIINTYNYLRDQKINPVIYGLSSFVLLTLFIESGISTHKLLDFTILTLLELLVTIFTYVVNYKNTKFYGYFIPYLLEALMLIATIEYDLSPNYLVILSSLLLLVPFIKIDVLKTLNPVIPATIVNTFTVITLTGEKNIAVIIALLIQVGAYYMLSLKDNSKYRILMYIFINILIINITNIINYDLNPYSLSIAFIINIIVDLMHNDKNFGLIMINYIISSYALLDESNLMSLIISLCSTLAIVAYIYDTKKKYYFIPLIGLWLTLLTNESLNGAGINYTIIPVALIALGLPLLTFYDKKIEKQYLMAYLYTITLVLLDANSYLVLIIASAVSILYLLTTNKKNKHKIVLIITTLLLYYNVMDDLGIVLTVCKAGILLVYTLLITRYIFNMPKRTSKVLEYLGFAIVSLFAISMYTSELDGMLFVGLLVVFTFISYINKYGPIFLTSIIFIIINLILLTIEFWLAIPWWIYILGVGVILLLFGINNEAKENNIKTRITDIKKKMDI